MSKSEQSQLAIAKTITFILSILAYTAFFTIVDAVSESEWYRGLVRAQNMGELFLYHAANVLSLFVFGIVTVLFAMLIIVILSDWFSDEKTQ